LPVPELDLLSVPWLLALLLIIVFVAAVVFASSFLVAMQQRHHAVGPGAAGLMNRITNVTSPSENPFPLALRPRRN
jgi:hypothetical protein